jgi:Ca-activated chloride channel family protein
MEAAREYLGSIKAVGGTNIHDALLEALKMSPTPGTLPMVLFLTDGLPTIGVRSESRILEAAELVNTHERRVFSFGVGYDVNAPLLTAVARDSRATSTFVLPEEDVEVKVGQVFRRLSGPVLARPELEVVGAPLGVPPVREILPGELPDLFDGDQLVVLGQFTRDRPVKLRLTGNYLGEARSFDLELDAGEAATANAFVPRLWAGRKIATLIEEIRRQGADGSTAPERRDDTRFKELVDEIVRLSKEFGILTEYTAFLATEPDRRDLAGVFEGDLDETLLGMPGAPAGGRGAAPRPEAEAARRLDARARGIRAGKGGVAQDINTNAQLERQTLNTRNAFLTDDMEEVAILSVRQIHDQTFYMRSERWVDARLLDEADAEPDETVDFGTDRYDEVLDELIERNLQGAVALKGQVFILLDGRKLLINGPTVGS